jgi:SAM-dependent methyltransferase
MHAEAMNWLKGAIPICGSRPIVFEFGALNVNGSARDLFSPTPHALVGVDLLAGPGVNIVADASTWDPGEWLRADAILCTEALEHAPDAMALCRNAYRLLRPLGVFIMTAAGPKRPPHSRGGHPDIPEGEAYANISPAWLADALAQIGFVRSLIGGDAQGQDVYCLALK